MTDQPQFPVQINLNFGSGPKSAGSGKVQNQGEAGSPASPQIPNIFREIFLLTAESSARYEATSQAWKNLLKAMELEP